MTRVSEGLVSVFGVGVFWFDVRFFKDGGECSSPLLTLLAQPAFAARGFRVLRHETVARDGETLDRAELEKVLGGLT